MSVCVCLRVCVRACVCAAEKFFTARLTVPQLCVTLSLLVANTPFALSRYLCNMLQLVIRCRSCESIVNHRGRHKFPL